LVLRSGKPKRKREKEGKRQQNDFALFSTAGCTNAEDRAFEAGELEVNCSNGGGAYVQMSFGPSAAGPIHTSGGRAAAQ
jgi:hypothetical protein